MKRLLCVAALVMLVLGIGGYFYAHRTPALPADPDVAMQQLMPHNAVNQQYADGSVIVIEGFRNPGRNYGFRSGEVIGLRVVVMRTGGVAVNLDSFRNHVFIDSNTGAPLEVVGTPTITNYLTGGVMLTVIDLDVRFLRIQPVITFQSTIGLAVKQDGKTVSVSAPTPDLPISTSNTATTASNQPVDPPVGKVWQTLPGWLQVLTPLSALFLLLVGAGIAAKKLRERFGKPKPPTSAERVWKQVDSIVGTSETGDLNYVQMRQLASLLRAYWAVSTVPVPELKGTLEQRFSGEDRAYERARVASDLLKAIEESLYRRPEGDQPAMNAAGTKRLLRQLERVVPKA